MESFPLVKKLQPLGNIMTVVEKPDLFYHRSKIHIHAMSPLWIFAEFDTFEQLDRLASQLGFTYTLERENEHKTCGKVSTYYLSHLLVDDSKWDGLDPEKIPEKAEKIKALSNGKIVDCYFVNDGAIIRFYRPNPNAKDIYYPLPIGRHIKHHEVYGRY